MPLPPLKWWPNLHQSHGVTSEEPVSHQLGSHLWHCLTTSLWAVCVDVLQMCQPGTSATGPSWHSMAEVGRDLWRLFCPTPWLGVSNSRVLRAVSHWVLNVYCQCRVLDKHTRGATTAAALCTVLDIVSSAAVVKKWKRGKKVFTSSGNYLQSCTLMSSYPITRRCLEKYTDMNQILILYFLPSIRTESYRYPLNN